MINIQETYLVAHEVPKCCDSLYDILLISYDSIEKGNHVIYLYNIVNSYIAIIYFLALLQPMISGIDWDSCVLEFLQLFDHYSELLHKYVMVFFLSYVYVLWFSYFYVYNDMLIPLYIIFRLYDPLQRINQATPYPNKIPKLIVDPSPIHF